MRAVFFTLIVAAAFASLGCDTIFRNGCPGDTGRWIEYRLYMGRGGPESEVVDDAEWDAFLIGAVTPRFPDGLTVLDAEGQWRGSNDAIDKESSKVLIILAPNDDEGAEELIEEVIDEYKREFSQESVLKTVSETCVAY